MSRLRLSPWRWAAGALAAIVALNLALALAVELIPEPGGPRSSSFATAPTGLAAYADLLAAQGRPVTRRREALEDPPLDPRATVVVLDPKSVRDVEARALQRFVARGGRLVIGGRGTDRALGTILDDPPARTARGVARPRVLAPVEGLAGGAPVRAAGAGGWSPAGEALPVLGDARAAVLALATRGRGRVLLLADPSPLQNRLLDRDGNAALGLVLAGPAGRRVVFAERAHGYEAASGLAALPTRWKVALGGARPRRAPLRRQSLATLRSGPPARPRLRTAAAPGLRGRSGRRPGSDPAAGGGRRARAGGGTPRARRPSPAVPGWRSRRDGRRRLAGGADGPGGGRGCGARPRRGGPPRGYGRACEAAAGARVRRPGAGTESLAAPGAEVIRAR